MTDSYGHLVTKGFASEFDPELASLNPDTYSSLLHPGAYRLASYVADTYHLSYPGADGLGPHASIVTLPRDMVVAGETRECDSCKRAGARQMGHVVKLAYTCSNCGCTAAGAFVLRHGLAQPELLEDLSPIMVMYSQFESEIQSEYLRQWLALGGVEGWLRKWPESKQKMITESQQYDVIRCDKVKSFAKIEFSSDEPKRGRLIQGAANCATQAEFGPEYYCLQKAATTFFFNRDVGHGIDITIASGMNGNDLSAWMDDKLARGATSFYERDGKSWDSTIRPEHFEIKYAFYRGTRVYGLEAFSRACQNVTGVCTTPQGLFVYRVKGTVKSGHNDTTLGNGLINAGFAYLTCVRFGLKASIIVTGDDLLIAVYGDFNLQDLISFESRLGIRPVAAKFHSSSDVSFVSGVWMHDSVRSYFVPKPGRLMARLFWTLNPPPPKQRDAYIRGVVKGLLPAMHCVPVIRAFLEVHNLAGEEIVENKKALMYRDCNYEMNPRIFDHFCERYGLLPQQVLDCEAWIRSLPREPLYLKHPVIDSILAVDLADAHERPTCAIIDTPLCQDIHYPGFSSKICV